MKNMLKLFAAALVAGTALAAVNASQARAETVLRADEVAVGELDPAKGTNGERLLAKLLQLAE